MIKRSLGLAVGWAMTGISVLGGVGQSVSAQEPLYCFDELVTIVAESPVTNGTSKADVIYVPAGDPVTVDGKGGSDIICSLNGDATIFGGAGNDRLEGLGTFYGDSGDDALTNDTDFGSQGIVGSSALYGGSGNDYISAEGVSIADGGSGNDTIIVGYSAQILGGSGNDEIYSLENGSTYGDAGNDVITAYGTDTVDCGSGSDRFGGENNGTVAQCERSKST